MTHHHSSERRAAFTLVEMLVASALILFMMWIIASAFEKALTSFRVLKTAGDMQEKLRAAATAIRRDLTRPHFTDNGQTWQGEDLSNQRLDDLNWAPPIEGYVKVFQQGTGDFEGIDPDDPSLRHFRSPRSDGSETIGHVLQFTARLKGIRRDQYYSVDNRDYGADSVLTNPAGDGLLRRFNFPVYNRRVQYPLENALGTGTDGTTPVDGTSAVFTTNWAEVTYFVRRNGEFAGNQPLYSLYRRQTLLAANLPETVSYSSGSRPLEFGSPYDPRYLEVSAWRKTSGTSLINGQAMVTAPCRRFAVDPNSPAGAYMNPIPTMTDQVGGNINDPLAATDLMMTNVTGFTVRAMWDVPATGGAPSATLANNPDYPFDTLPASSSNPSFGSDRVFDTWSQRVPPSGGADNYANWKTPGSAKSIPLQIRIRAIQIELRIWDQKSQQTRQITIIQDL